MLAGCARTLCDACLPYFLYTVYSRGTHGVDLLDYSQVFPPTFRELDAPALELFDLDDQFSSERARLAQLTNKCELSLRGSGPVHAVFPPSLLLLPPPWCVPVIRQ